MKFYLKTILLSAVMMLCFLGTLKAQVTSCSLAAKFYSKDSINITTFGASTVHGINGFLFQPYLQKDFEQCYAGKVVDITNNGISGQTTTQGLARFDQAIAGRTGFVCILMGINDIFAITNSKVKLSTSQINAQLAVTQSNIQKMIDKSLAANLTVILGTIQYVVPNNTANRLANSYITTTNNGYKKLIDKNKIYLADINAALNYNVALYQADGLHPNALGDNNIAYVWFDSINNAIENKFLLVGLSQNFPNPASNSTTIDFTLTDPNRVVLQLYNMNGSLVKTIADGFYNSGLQEISVPVNNLSPGIYIYTMQIAGRILSKKMIVIH